jgi:hypothetical protein
MSRFLRSVSQLNVNFEFLISLTLHLFAVAGIYASVTLLH